MKDLATRTATLMHDVAVAHETAPDDLKSDIEDAIAALHQAKSAIYRAIRIQETLTTLKESA